MSPSPALYYYTTSHAEAGDEFPIRWAHHRRSGCQRGAARPVAPSYVFRHPPPLGAQAALSLGAAVGRRRRRSSRRSRGPAAVLFRAMNMSRRAGRSICIRSPWSSGKSRHEQRDGLHDVGRSRGRLRSRRDSETPALNHWSGDPGAGYTYLKQRSERRSSPQPWASTYNFENAGTNGPRTASTDTWISPLRRTSSRRPATWESWGTPTCSLSGDHGEGANLGDFKSQVMGFGPLVCWFIGERKWYLYMEGYDQYNARNRPRGWNVWLTVAFFRSGENS